MKIKKSNFEEFNNNIKLPKKGASSKQALKDLEEAKTLEEDTATPDTVTNPDSLSKDKLTDYVADAISDESEGKVELSDKDAKEFATDVEKAIDKFDIDSLGILDNKNSIFNLLDHALDQAKHEQNRQKFVPEKYRENAGGNVLLIGLPGSGKTAIVKAWCQKAGVNYAYIDAKDSDLSAYIRGYSMKDDTKPNSVVRAPSNSLNRLDKPNTILFLDEFNRQLDPSLRGSLLSLINERVIPDDNSPGGYRHFPNILFTIVLINPAGTADRGAAALIQAEKSRFRYQMLADSNANDAANYFDNYYIKQMVFLTNYYNESKEKDIKEFTENFLELAREHELIMSIVFDVNFVFDNVDDLDALDDEASNYVIFNQRMLTEILKDSRGDCDRFLQHVENRTNFLPERMDMLCNAVKKLKRNRKSPETLVTYWSNKIIDLSKKRTEFKDIPRIPKEDLLAAISGGKVSTKVDEKPEEIEDDEAMFGTPTEKGSKRDVAEIRRALADADADFDF